MVVGLVVAAGLYFFWSMWYSPRAEEVGNLETRLEQLDTENRRAQIVATRGAEDLEERLALYERYVIQLEQLIPEREEVAGLLNDVAREALRHNVEIALQRPEAANVGQYYTRDSYEYQLYGEYHDVGRFLTVIASLPRIITPVDVELAVLQGRDDLVDMESPVQVTLRLETYVIPAPGEELGAAEEAEAPPGSPLTTGGAP